MMFRRPRKRGRSPSFGSVPSRGRRRKQRAAVSALLILFAVLVFLACSAAYLRSVSTDIAVSDASDIVSSRINTAIAALMREGDYDGSYFVTFEKAQNGEVSAISCNMARINALSAEILERVVDVTENYTATVRIPAGNLTGISLLMGRGPKIPVDIITLTSSRIGFNNSIVTAGINQTKHQITLQVTVDIDVLVPWGRKSTQVSTEILIADTVIVGQVPDTYLSMDNGG